MTKKNVIFGLLGLFVILIISALFLKDYIADRIGIENLYAPREPKYEVETTANIGWWSFQNEMEIESFNVKIIESNLNLFNSNSLLSYTVKGYLKGDPNWRPYIGKVHVSQRFLRIRDKSLHPYLDKDTSKIPEALIDITPIVVTKEDNSYNGEVILFNFTNELKVQSFHYGDNWIRFKCDTLSKDLFLKQYK